jgi:DNA-binding winged helix-turn-helix (wHTH) protein
MIRFADCTLDTDARRIVRGAREVHLSPKAFALLTLLVESRPRAVAKAELVERIWPDTFVSDDSLAKVVSKIREAIGHSEDTPIVRTVHGYGYAFAAAIEQESPQADSRATTGPPPCWLLCGDQEFALRDGEHIVGREPTATIRLNSPKVSRRHARVLVNGRNATVEDLGSKNGTFVRGIRIASTMALASGDATRIGPFTLVFLIRAESASTESELR